MGRDSVGRVDALDTKIILKDQEHELLCLSASCSRVLRQRCNHHGGVLRFTLGIDNNTTLHGAHTDTIAFSRSSVLINCMFCSYPQLLARTPHEWLKKTIHDKLVIFFYHRQGLPEGSRGDSSCLWQSHPLESAVGAQQRL